MAFTALWRDGRPLKRWRYVGVYGADLMCCFGSVSIGGLPQSFWAVWDREAKVLRERTRFRAGRVQLADGRVRVRDRGVAIDLAFDEREGIPIEIRSPHGSSEIWTRKRAGLRFAGSVVLDGIERPLVARGVIDDSAGYHARETAWSWSAGVGTGEGGEELAWNLVDGVHDAPTGSERAIWVDGQPYEPPPVRFDTALTTVASADGGVALACAHESVRRRDDNVIVMRSRYEQPFGTFSGALPNGLRLAEGFGVMERHDVRW
ncbi:MAG: hypothetical protein JWM73_1398 [Solirubrobacterales bacterium]|nr:hypothetical protein [Solirubrobacterales bacterium]